MRIISCSHAATTICAGCLLINLRQERLSIGEALMRITLARPIHDAHDLGLEGWGFFNLELSAEEAEDYLGAGIERYDEEAIFTDDDKAIEFVAERAAAGSAPHLAALIIHGACDSIRAILWGEQWVDSRIGPDPGQFGSRNDQPTLIRGGGR